MNCPEPQYISYVPVLGAAIVIKRYPLAGTEPADTVIGTVTPDSAVVTVGEVAEPMRVVTPADVDVYTLIVNVPVGAGAASIASVIINQLLDGDIVNGTLNPDSAVVVVWYSPSDNVLKYWLPWTFPSLDVIALLIRPVNPEPVVAVIFVPVEDALKPTNPTIMSLLNVVVSVAAGLPLFPDAVTADPSNGLVVSTLVIPTANSDAVPAVDNVAVMLKDDSAVVVTAYHSSTSLAIEVVPL